jgi:hypothetical protein
MLIRGRVLQIAIYVCVRQWEKSASHGHRFEYLVLFLLWRPLKIEEGYRGVLQNFGIFSLKILRSVFLFS